MRVETGQLDAEELQDQRPAGEQESGSDLSISDIVRMLGRHKWFILICTIVCVLIAAVYAKEATPIFQATASMRIDPGRAGSLGLGDLLSGGGYQDPDVLTKTEISILQSDAVAIDTLNSLSNEEFLRFSGIEKSVTAIPQGTSELNVQQENLMGMLKGGLTAKQIEGTQLVAVSFTSTKPDVAAFMVNHLMDAYLRQTFDSRYTSVSQVTKWLSAEMDSLKDRAAEAQRRLAAFQEQNNILGADASNNTTIDRLRLLNNRLAEAQAERIVKEAQMRAAATGNPQVLAAMFPNPDLGSLESEQGTLYAQYAQMSTKFGPNYPPLVDLKRQMQKIDAEIEHQVDSVRARMKQDYDAASTTEKLLQTQYDEQTEKAYALNRQQAEYAVLAAEGSSSRDLYDTLQYKLQQAGVDAGLNGVNTMLVDRARAPRMPIAPRKRLILSFGFILGLLAGVGSAFLREAATDNIQDAEQIERIMGYHLLALIPHISVGGKGAKGAVAASPVSATPMLMTYNEPLSRDAEAYRTMRNSLLLSSIDHPYKTMLVTSTLPGEGKSNTASNYAVVLAQRGARVLAIDGDLRRPTLHERFALQNNLGLSNLILGEETVEPFITPFPDLPNLTILTAGKKVPLPSEALSSTKFYTLLQKWESEFDYVVIDSAPLLIVSDSLPMASWADALILVTRYNTTPIRALRRVRDILNRTNANVAGVIINDVPESGASYGGYGYGYGEYYN